MDGGRVDVEGSGDFADRPALLDQCEGEGMIAAQALRDLQLCPRLPLGAECAYDAQVMHKESACSAPISPRSPTSMV